VRTGAERKRTAAALLFPESLNRRRYLHFFGDAFFGGAATFFSGFAGTAFLPAM